MNNKHICVSYLMLRTQINTIVVTNESFIIIPNTLNIDRKLLFLVT
jgi:hypothetical protein